MRTHRSVRGRCDRTLTAALKRASRSAFQPGGIVEREGGGDLRLRTPSLFVLEATNRSRISAAPADVRFHEDADEILLFGGQVAERRPNTSWQILLRGGRLGSLKHAFMPDRPQRRQSRSSASGPGPSAPAPRPARRRHPHTGRAMVTFSAMTYCSSCFRLASSFACTLASISRRRIFPRRRRPDGRPGRAGLRLWHAAWRHRLRARRPRGRRQ